MTEIEFKKHLWVAANKLRGSLSAAEYKYPVLGLVFLKYVSDIFKVQRDVIVSRMADPDSDMYIDDEELRAEAVDVMVEDRDSYTQDNVFWIPTEARYSDILKQASNTKIASILDNAMSAIEKENPKLVGVLYRDFGRLSIDSGKLGDLIEIIGRMTFNPIDHHSRDIFGEVYEYFLGNFALEEGQKAGQFYTPRSIVQTLVDILAPFEGRIYDPACGSGGMFVYSERFIEEHGGKKGQAVIFGQEMTDTTRKMACMNLAIRGIDYDLGKKPADTFNDDQHPNLRADYILANPPFNLKNWGAKALASDPRWEYGAPPEGNANYAWLQHILARLSTNGRAGVVLANGSTSSNTSGEGDIRKAMVKGDVVECMVALPGQLFTNTQISACLWFLSKNKAAGKNGNHDRRNQVLFIDARKLGDMISRKQMAFGVDDIKLIAQTYHNWRDTQWGEGDYQNLDGFCNSASLADIEKQGFTLTPGRYVGAEEVEDDGVPFEEKMGILTGLLKTNLEQSDQLAADLKNNLAGLGYEL
tara:strand:- start:5899 stop:7485 length:1587 start_codon:yes stop_codon:yes gene_type:complete